MKDRCAELCEVILLTTSVPEPIWRWPRTLRSREPWRSQNAGASSFSQRFSLQTKNAVLTPAVPQIHSHRQTISIRANRVSPAIFFCARRHRRRIQFSRQLLQDLCEHFFRISLHRTSRFRPLQVWFTPLRRLAMLLQGLISFSCDRTLSALITASLTPSVIGDRPSPICWQQLTLYCHLPLSNIRRVDNSSGLRKYSSPVSPRINLGCGHPTLQTSEHGELRWRNYEFLSCVLSRQGREPRHLPQLAD